MTNGDFERKVDSLLNLQAQADARLGKLEEIVTRLANSSLERITNLEDKMNVLIDTQIKAGDTVAALSESVDRMTEAQRRLTEAQRQLTEAQAHTDQKLNVLIDIISEGRDGRSQK